jgi:putative alpha-1,2-mannosidase
MSLNGGDLNRTFVQFSDVVKGGSLKLNMGSEPKDNY